jgi:thiol-disulfide isomerase/thioredoxin
MKNFLSTIAILILISLEIKAANIKLNFEENLIKQYKIEEVIFYNNMGYSWNDHSQNIIEVIKLDQTKNEYSLTLEVDYLSKIKIEFFPLSTIRAYLIKRDGKYEINISANQTAFPDVEFRNIYSETSLNDLYSEYLKKYPRHKYSNLAELNDFNIDTIDSLIENLNKEKLLFIDSLLLSTDYNDGMLVEFFRKKIKYDNDLIKIENITSILENKKNFNIKNFTIENTIPQDNYSDRIKYDCYPLRYYEEFARNFYKLKRPEDKLSLDSLIEFYFEIFESDVANQLVAYSLEDFIIFYVDFENIEKNGNRAEKLLNKYSSIIGDYATNYLLKELEKKRILLPGSKIPQFQIEDTLGNFVEISNYLDKNTLIYIWTSWCTPCIQSFKNIEQYKKILNKNGFSLVLLSLDSDRIKWKKGIIQNNIKDYNNFLSIGGPSGIAGSNLGINAVPTFILVDSEGKVIKVPMDFPTDAELKKLLQ